MWINTQIILSNDMWEHHVVGFDFFFFLEERSNGHVESTGRGPIRLAITFGQMKILFSSF